MKTLTSLRRLSTAAVKQIKPKRVLVTGGSKGIGLGLTEVFALKSCNVLSVDIDKKANNELIESAININNNIECLTLDVTDSNAAKESIKFMINKWNGIDILINNVGIEIANDKKMHELDEEIWHKMMNVNINSFFYFSKYAVIQMLSQINNDKNKNKNKDKSNYNIINIASPCGLVGVPNHAAYCSSKGATISLTKQMAIEYGSLIRVNAITPGPTLTPNVQRVFNEMGVENTDKFVKDHPLGRWGDPIEYGKLAYYLSSDDATWLLMVELLLLHHGYIKIN